MYSLLSSFKRISITNVTQSTRMISTCNPNFFKATPCLLAEPLKKKKRMDPGIIKAREERRRKKLEKQIRRLEKNAKQMKPIEELEIPLEYIDNKEGRIRPKIKQTPEDVERIAILQKQWSKYTYSEIMADIKTMDKLVASQSKALKALREVSEELYQAAVEIDQNIMPVTITGTVNTPPIKNYNVPDGEYSDLSRKWSN